MIAQNKQKDELETILVTETKRFFGVTIREPVDDLLERIHAFEEQFLKPEVDTTKTFAQAKRAYMRSYLDTVLTSSYGIIRRAAQNAGVAHTTFYRACTEYGIDVQTYRSNLALPSEERKEALTEMMKSTLMRYASYIPDDQKEQKDAEAQHLAEKINPYVHLQVPALAEAESNFEREYLQQALAANDYNVKNTAEAADMQPRTLYRMMDTYRLGKQEVSSSLIPEQGNEIMPEMKAA